MPVLSPAMKGRLCCPGCRAPLEPGAEGLRCTGCAAPFPVVDGVPILIDGQKSVFDPDAYVARRSTTTDLDRPRWKRRLWRLVPDLSRSVKSEGNCRRLLSLLLERSPHPIVLVVGGAVVGFGLDSLIEHPAVELVETDVSFGPRTALICDGHDLPFADASFDAAILQAVLEHVADPYRCVEEIHRVLRPAGLVYAETPFMQQVHGGCYDFTRFTDLGHRRLFRRFTEIERGAGGGPGMALAWSYQYFLLSFVRSHGMRLLLQAFAGCTAFWLKYFDAWLIDRPGTQDAAAAYFFLGQRSDENLSDRTLLASYRGAQI